MKEKSIAIERNKSPKHFNVKNRFKIVKACSANPKDTGVGNILRFFPRNENHSLKQNVEKRKETQIACKYPMTNVNYLQNISCKMTNVDSKLKNANATLRVALKNKCVIKDSKSSPLKVLANREMSHGKDNSDCPYPIKNITKVLMENAALNHSRNVRTNSKRKKRQVGKMVKSVWTSKENGRSPASGNRLQTTEANNIKKFLQMKNNNVFKKHSDMSQWPVKKSDCKESHFKRLSKGSFTENDNKKIDKASGEHGFKSEFVFRDKPRQQDSPETFDVALKNEVCKLPIGDESWNKPGPSSKYCWPPEHMLEDKNNSISERTSQASCILDSCANLFEPLSTGTSFTDIDGLENQYDFISNFMINLTEDGLVKKKVIRETDGPTVPHGSLVYIHFTAYMESYKDPYNSSYYTELPVRGVLGQNHFISGLDIGIRTMKLGEISAFLIDSLYGFGTNEIPRHNICKNRLLIRVEIIKFRALHVGEIIERRKTHIFKFILKLAKELYFQGVQLNEHNKITSAAERFKLIIALLSLTHFNGKALNTHKTYLMNESMLNLAVFYNNKRRFHSAILSCMNILEQYPDNYKARLNFFKAVVAVRAYNKAYEFLKHVWKKKKEIMAYHYLEREFLSSSHDKVHVLVPKQDYHLSASMRFKRWCHLERLKKFFVQRYMPVKLRGVNKVLLTTKWKRASSSM